MTADPFDLLIVGGGINGAGIARDAAGRGLSVLLVEQDDLAAHTSSASTKLIHGGLRYLEHYDFRLVREALAERERLLAIAPHIVWPLEFVLPHAKGQRPAWMIRAGLFLYDHLAARRRLPASRALRFPPHPAAAALRAEFTRGFAYADCWVEDSRLVVLTARDAAERGAAIRPRTKLIAARHEGGLWRAEIAGGTVRARALVNAAGPWVNIVQEAALGRAPARAVRLVQGSHIVVPRLYAGEFALLLQNPDGRVIFVIPYEGRFSLIGTTDTNFDGDPARTAITDEEIAYLCAGASRFLRATVAPGDVVRAFSGVRPLYDDHAANAAAVTRDYVLDLDPGPAPLLSVYGGKITTHRRLAEQAVAKLLAALGRQAAPSWTATAPLPGGDIPGGDFAAFAAAFAAEHDFLPPALALRLARAYGTRAALVLGGARGMAALGEDFGGGLTEAEVSYLIDNEWAAGAEDILWRRSKLALHVPPGTAQRLERRLAGVPATAEH
ncbi:MAG: glycerol-3-phosphate dehydrogenase [Rhodospirillales bacterium]|nr:glycerol-3-phosphate dehydrogenase [Rhodospirillales bacterium]